MEAYTGFAQVYDAFMDNVPYDEWADYVVSLLRGRGIADGLVAELGCGTGAMTERLGRAGYEMIGIDSSGEMLQIARQKYADALYLQQDMCEFELYGTVRAVISVCDCMNYILEREQLREVFRLADNYLDPGGVFIFDLNTPYKYRELLGDRTFAEDRDTCSFIWQNEFDEETGINEYDLTLFVRCDTDERGSKAACREPGEKVYKKYEEVHYQKCYEIADVLDMLHEAGLRVEAVYDACTEGPPRRDSERVHIVARECKKTWDDLESCAALEDAHELEQVLESYRLNLEE